MVIPYVDIYMAGNRLDDGCCDRIGLDDWRSEMAHASCYYGLAVGFAG